jgi:hypothetical protein
VALQKGNASSFLSPIEGFANPGAGQCGSSRGLEFGLGTNTSVNNRLEIYQMNSI